MPYYTNNFVASKQTDGSTKWYVKLTCPLNLEAAALAFWLNKPITGFQLKLQLAPECDTYAAPTKKDYLFVTPRHQIDRQGELFVSTAWNIRQQLSPSSQNFVALDSEGIRFANQYDFDKFCSENPDPRFPLAWNAHVFKAFLKWQEKDRGTTMRRVLRMMDTGGDFT